MKTKTLSEYIVGGTKEAKPLSSFIVEDTEEPKKRITVTPGKGDWVDNLIDDYIEGYPRHYLQTKYQVSSGQISSHLQARGVPLRYLKTSETTLLKRLSHLTEADIENIIEDYNSGKSNREIYETYDIHKNGLYNILDSHGVPRKSIG